MFETTCDRHDLRPVRIAAILLCAAGVAACDDAPTEPLAALVTQESAVALEVGAALPEFPRLLERGRRAQRMEAGHGDGALGTEARALDHAAALWYRAMSETKPERAAVFRDAAYRAASPPLARRLGRADVLTRRDEVARWLAAAERALAASDADPIAVRLAEAEVWMDAAADAAEAGDSEAVLLAVLRAGDRLAETTAEAVATRLIRNVEAAMGERGSAEPELDPVTWRRAERLVRGARDALHAGDASRAIRRAFYASQLLSLE